MKEKIVRAKVFFFSKKFTLSGHCYDKGKKKGANFETDINLHMDKNMSKMYSNDCAQDSRN